MARGHSRNHEWNRRRPGAVRFAAAALRSLILGLCAATVARAPAAGPAVLAEAPMNRDAGRGNLLIVTLRLEDGEPLSLVVDTGSEATIVDKSLERKLGKRVGTGKLWNFGVKHKCGVYPTPKLYLGDLRLRTGDNVFSIELKRMAVHTDPAVRGILGMDCLRYYCVQLDFEAGKLRLLDSSQLAAENLGRALPMTLMGLGNSHGECMRPFVYSCGLLGGGITNLLVDTGYRVDGALEGGLYRRGMGAEGLPLVVEPIRSLELGRLWVEQITWNGATYRELLIGNGGTDFSTGNGQNLLGLRFLARHLATFDFPTRTFYLRPTRADPLASAYQETATECLNRLKAAGRLPGWADRDPGRLYCDADVDFAVFDGRKPGDASTYHYLLRRAARDQPWTLQSAWRTDQTGRISQKYRVP